MTNQVTIKEVAARDGLQAQSVEISLDQRRELILSLVAAGVPESTWTPSTSASTMGRASSRRPCLRVTTSHSSFMHVHVHAQHAHVHVPSSLRVPKVEGRAAGLPDSRCFSAVY